MADVVAGEKDCMNKIILAGGSGFLGGELARHFLALGWDVVVLTRKPKFRSAPVSGAATSESRTASDNTSVSHQPCGAVPGDGHAPERSTVREIFWDAKSLGDWAREFEGATAVVNLTGRSVDCR